MKLLAARPNDQSLSEWELHTLQDRRWNGNRQRPIIYGSGDIMKTRRWLMRQPAYADHPIYTPQCCFHSNSPQERLYTEIHTPDWWWETSVSKRSKFRGRLRVRFNPATEPLQRVTTQNLLLKRQHFLLQLRIWVLIVSQHEQYVDCAVLVAPSPPAFRFAIREVLVGSPSKTRQFRLNTAFISQPLNEYQSDRKSDSGRWKSD